MDSQSLNDDIVIQLTQTHFGRIEEPLKDRLGGYSVTVGAAASWWRVLGRVARLGLMPPSFPTAGGGTVGGTLSADCVSRCSAIYGKEGEQIRRFRIILSDGTAVTCSRADTGDRERLFNAVIGGFGYLGVVTEVTFDLVAVESNPLTQRPKPPTVFTRATRYGSSPDWTSLLRLLYLRGQRDHERVLAQRRASQGEDCRLPESTEWHALSIASFQVGTGLSANLLEQRYLPDQPLRPAPGGTYAQRAEILASGELGLSCVPTAIQFATDIGFPQGEFVDDLFGWAFFLHNSTKIAKERAARSGDRINFTQHSFALPSLANGDSIDTRAVRRFIEFVEARLHEHDERGAVIDFLHVPEDRFTLSASHKFASFVVTISLVNRGQIHMPERVRQMMLALSHDCRVLGGKVHLVKNVIAEASDLRAMHGEASAEFLTVKRQVDVKDLFRNEFFERVLLA